MTDDEAVAFRFPAQSFARLDPEAAARVIGSAGDLAIVVDRAGVIRDLGAANLSSLPAGAAQWIDQPWATTVAPDSREKIDEILADALSDRPPRWREINHVDAGGEIVPVRYLAIQTAADGPLIAIGRDLRQAAVMQQRILQAQQAMERDYALLRQTEQRYRLMFQLVAEAILVVDHASGRILELNPSAVRMLGGEEDALGGELFADLFDEESRDGAVTILSAPPATSAMRLKLRAGGECSASASLFRHGRAVHVMVRLSRPETAADAGPDDAGKRLLDAMERLPDAFVVTDEQLRILVCNGAFLEFVQLAAPAQAENQPLERFLGRPGVDMKVLTAGLREHGVVRNFATVLRSRYETSEEVEISGVSMLDTRTPSFAFSIRSVGRRLRDQPNAGRELPRSVSQLTSLVGRVSLKEIVRETTDRIERLCIEAALELTADNRASAAELLGLSRQSFYSKLHRHGIGNLSGEEE